MARKKLEGNGLWESSRFMMPEHERRILEDERKSNLRSRPDLDPQELEYIQWVIMQSQ